MTGNFTSRINAYLIKIFIFLSFLLEIEAKANISDENLPQKILILYNQPLKTENTGYILNQFSQGRSVDTVHLGPTRVMKSVWIYIPGELVKKDTLKKYFLIGYYEFNDLYQLDNGQWRKISTGGIYKKSKDYNSKSGRYFFKLFNDGEDIAEAYLIACRRFDDYVYSQLESRLVSSEELKEWKINYDHSKEWFNRMTLPFWGILFLTTVVFASRYISSKNKAYLMYSIGNAFFTLNCILLYFADPVNVEYYPLTDPFLGVSITGPVFIVGVGYFIYSFKYFYNKEYLVDLAKKIPFWSLLACIALAMINSILNYQFKILYVTNIVMYVFLVSLIIIIYLILVYYRSFFLRYPLTNTFVTIAYGSSFIAIASVLGFVLSTVYAQNSMSLGKFHLQSFPLLVGIAVYNIFVLVVFSLRDQEIYEEAGRFKHKVLEYEMRALQSSLNPHFIFNSLNLIDFFMYRKDLLLARETLFQFSDLLRMVIDSTTEKMITLSEELKMLELYLKLEKSRLEGKMNYSIEIHPDIHPDQIYIPPLLIQPLAENAIKHGIQNRGEGIVMVKVHSKNGFLLINVIDNGIGFTNTKKLFSTTKRRNHLGIELTRRRLSILSELASLEIMNMNDKEGANVLIKIPL